MCVCVCVCVCYACVYLTEQRVTCVSGRLIKHTKKLMEKEEKMCIKILQTLRAMLDKRESMEETVSGSPRLPSSLLVSPCLS